MSLEHNYLDDVANKNVSNSKIVLSTDLSIMTFQINIDHSIIFYMQGSSVRKIKVLAFLLVTITVSACNGNSNSDPSPYNSTTPSSQAATPCTGEKTIILRGIEVRVADFDTDRNGCLYLDELFNASKFAAEQSIQQLEAKSRLVTGTNHSLSTSKIIQARIIGSSDISNQLIQLHSNINSGHFFIELEINNLSMQEETLRVFFDDDSYEMEKNATAPPSFDVNPPLQGLSTVVISCFYMNDFTIDCDTADVFPTGNINNSNILSAPLDLTFDLNWTFSSRFLPQTGNIIISYCSGIAAESKCFNNFVEIGTLFN